MKAQKRSVLIVAVVFIAVAAIASFVLVQVIFIRRGRVYYQKSGEQLLEESQDIIKEKMKEWINAQ